MTYVASTNPPWTAEAMFAEATKHKARRLVRLRAVAAKNLRKGRRYSRLVLQDPLVLTATFQEVCFRRGIEIGSKDGPSYPEAIKKLQTMTLWSRSKERALLVPKERNNASIRWVHWLGVVEATKSRLAMQVARILAPASPRQFILQGRLKFERWLAANLPKAALVVTTDIPSCFDTISQSSVDVGLPLPRRVTKALLYNIKRSALRLSPGPNGKFIPSEKDLDEDTFVGVSSPKRGIPQGAALSSVASEVVIQRVLMSAEDAAPGIHAASYGDNLILVAEDAAAGASGFEALASAIGVHFGPDVIGELTHRKREATPVAGFDFCGVVYSWKDGELKRHVARDRLDNYAIRFATRLGDAKCKSDFDSLRRSLKGWLAQNAFSTKAQELALELAAELAQIEG